MLIATGVGQQDRCLVHRDHQLWPNQAPLELEPATYVRVAVPPPDDSRIPTLRAIAIALKENPWEVDDCDESEPAAGPEVQPFFGSHDWVPQWC